MQNQTSKVQLIKVTIGATRGRCSRTTLNLSIFKGYFNLNNGKSICLILFPAAPEVEQPAEQQDLLPSRTSSSS